MARKGRLRSRLRRETAETGDPEISAGPARRQNPRRRNPRRSGGAGRRG